MGERHVKMVFVMFKVGAGVVKAVLFVVKASPWPFLACGFWQIGTDLFIMNQIRMWGGEKKD